MQEYRQQFETLMYHLMSLDPSLSPKFFLSQFLLGIWECVFRLQKTLPTRQSLLEFKKRNSSCNGYRDTALHPRDDRLHLQYQFQPVQLRPPSQAATTTAESSNCTSFDEQMDCAFVVVTNTHENTSANAPDKY